MNILTNNRILEAGDEYLTGEDWKPIPAGDIGLQIMFTKYAKVRRPKEPEAISPDSEAHAPSGTEAEPAKAESDKIPAPSHSGAGVIFPKAKPLSETYGKAKPKELPTVVSKKAHGKQRMTKPALDPAYGESENITLTPVPVITPPHPKMHTTVIPYTDLSSKPIWIGRNGTFNATGMTITHTENGLIQIRPSGARGLAKNALIEFPDAEIDKVVDFLLRHQPTKYTPK